MVGSPEEVVRATHGLILSLEQAGAPRAAARLREGLAELNGLTDGWARFLESVEDVERHEAVRLSAPERSALAAIRQAAYGAVHRRPPRPWWRFW